MSPSGKSDGAWDSIHVFEAVDRARTAHYKLTSTVILHLSTQADSLGEIDLSGNMTRQIEQDLPVDDDSSHIANIGKVSQVGKRGGLEVNGWADGGRNGTEDEEFAT